MPCPEGLWEEEDRLLENLKFGLLLGGEVGVRKLREKLGSGVVREQPQSRQLSRSVAVGEVLERFRDELGLKEEEWAELRKPVRRRRRPLRDVLIYLALRGSDETLGAIGEYFGVGYTTIANARTRGEAHLQKDRKLRRKLGKFLP